MDEKKWLDEIENSARDLTTPSSLSPVNIKKKLDERKQKNSGVNWKKTAVRLAELAAVFAMVFAVGSQMDGLGLKQAVQDRLAGGGKPRQEEVLLAAETEEPDTEAATEEKISEKPGSEATTEEKISEKPESEAVAEEETTERPESEAIAKKGITEKSESEAVSEGKEMEETEGKVKTEEKEKKILRLSETSEAQDGTDPKSDIQEKERLPQGMTILSSEKELYEKLAEHREEDISWMARNGAVLYEGDTMENMAADVSGNSAPQTQSGADHSRTNLRETDVDEADRVKTDGEYLYVVKKNREVVIIKADGAKMTQVTSIAPQELDETIWEIYLDENVLQVVTGGSQSSMAELEEDVYQTKTYDYVKLLTYDISNREKPQLLGSVEQEGYYRGSRKSGDHVYLFTQFDPRLGENQGDSGIMPLVEGQKMDVADIYVPESLENTSYLVIGAVDAAAPDQMASHKAVVSGAQDFYVSAESIYVMNSLWEPDKGESTEILKFSYDGSDIRGVGSCRVDGYLNDSFSLDEYEGYLRVLATDWEEKEINTLYVFDEKLELVGKIDDIAPGETIRSVRMLGDTGYFVTFRTVDPLFTVDLSDPENPQIVGELKVSGFSSYLHFYGEDRLLGIGYEADEKTGATTGIKLSMFDISDPAKVTEVKRLVLKDATYCPAMNDYKAIMIDPEKNLFGFVCDSNYLVFTFDEENGFENLLTYNTAQGRDSEYTWYASGDMRGLYIEDTFYLADEEAIYAFDMTGDFSLEERLDF